MFCDYMESPIGILKITANHNFIKGVELVNAADTPLPNELTEQCRQQLTQYFEQKRTEFSLPLAPNGTAFEKEFGAGYAKFPTEVRSPIRRRPGQPEIKTPGGQRAPRWEKILFYCSFPVTA